MTALVPHVLLTGFEPFDGDALNPSRETVKALAGARVAGLEVRGTVLPVEDRAARATLRPLLHETGLRAVVMLGLAGGRARIAVERVALNLLDYRMPDSAGTRRRDEPCAPGGPAAYFTSLPSREIVAELAAADIPASLSESAGTFLCNAMLYFSLHTLAEAGHPVPAGFIHLPYLPSMVVARASELPSMEFSLMVRAVEIALQVTALSVQTAAPSH
jgi:pyroglutamyl-peptidase